MVHFIEGNTIGEVWLKSLQAVLTRGRRLPDDKGWIRELSPLYLSIVNPLENDPLIHAYGDPAQLSFLQRNFEDPSPIPGWSYSYAGRLFNYEGYDQIAAVVHRLQERPFAKSATATLLRPGADDQHTPCLCTLDVKVRDGALGLHVFFRSQDTGKKMYGDALCLLRLGKKMGAVLSLDRIHLHMTVASAHVYEADLAGVEALLSSCSLALR